MAAVFMKQKCFDYYFYHMWPIKRTCCSNLRKSPSGNICISYTKAEISLNCVLFQFVLGLTQSFELRVGLQQILPE